jgi:hypothetical protein
LVRHLTFSIRHLRHHTERCSTACWLEL